MRAHISAHRSVPAKAQCKCASRGAVYFVLPQHSPEGKLTPPTRSPIVARGDSQKRRTRAPRCAISSCDSRAMQATPDKAIDAYRVQAGAVTELQAEFYNFEADGVSGTTAAVGACRLESGARPCDGGGRSG